MYIWIIILIISLVVELLTLSLVSLWFIVGAVAGLILNLLDFSVTSQIMAFVVGSVFTFIVIRPKLVKFVKTPKEATNSDKLIGELGEVTKIITQLENGEVKVRGQVWTAKSEESEDLLPKDLVVVDRIEGAKLVVRKRRD